MLTVGGLLVVLLAVVTDPSSDLVEPRQATLLSAGMTWHAMAEAGEFAYPPLPRALRQIEYSGSTSPEDLTRVVQQTCVACHNDQLMTANLSLQHFDVARAHESAEVAEMVIGKLQAEMMPPPGIPRPGGDTLLMLAASLEEGLDRYAAASPRLSSRPFQRLNRAEYERAIWDLLGIRIDAGNWLPLDQYQANFDNMAAVQEVSATLLTAYLNAAADISRFAVGQVDAPAIARSYRVPESRSQHQWDQVEGAPYGTRGGIVVDHFFPADGEYTFDLSFYGGGREARFEEVDISVAGRTVKRFPYPGTLISDTRYGEGFRVGPFHLPAGQHKVAVSFVPTADGPYEDLIRPHDGGHAGRSAYGTTGLPHLREVTITGPENPSGVAETDSRRRVFTCRPGSQVAARECAEEIVRRLASQAFRRPVDDGTVAEIMSFYDMEEAHAGFEVGVRTALEAILASPLFTFRLERQPTGAQAGSTYRLTDLDLASRLSFFLWGTLPDEELLRVAVEGRLGDPEVLEAQARRLLADRRGDALGERFAAQWLRLQDMLKVQPDVFWFPNFTDQIQADMRRETELFFNHLVREDRSVLELFTADYSFMNERLARHYGISGVRGDEFRPVGYPEGSPRSGIFGHGSILLLTSMGNRTSPTLRGKWVMEALLGTPPPPPPPVPALDETAATTADGRQLTGRERLEIHSANPTCNACHQYMDPIGVALENYDVDGTWRTRERGTGLTVDSQGTLYDGTAIDNPAALAEALLQRPTPLLRTFTQNLMAYALGRRLEYSDQPAVRRIVREAAESDYLLSAFILGVIRSEQFQLRTVETITDDLESGW